MLYPFYIINNLYYKHLIKLFNQSVSSYIWLTILLPFGSFRHTGTDPNLKELNYNTVPAFRNKNLIEANQVDSHSLKNGTTQDHIICDDSKQYRGRDMRSDDPIKSSRQRKINNLVTQGISSDVPKQLSKRKNYRYCCFTH